MTENSEHYPVRIERVSLKHKGGTKAFHLYVISNIQGKSLFVTRWGRIGAFGSIKVEEFDTRKEAEKAFGKKLNEKTSRGYRNDNNGGEIANAQDEFSTKVGMILFNKLGAKAVNHIDPDYDTTGMREVDPPQYDEETGARLDAQRRFSDEQMIKMKEQAEREQREMKEAADAARMKKYKDNPLFGAF